MRRIAPLALVLALAATASPAHADSDDDVKSPTTAALLSIGGTAASIATMAAVIDSERAFPLGLASLAIAPSLGEIYAGQYVTVGMGLRAAGVAVAYKSFVELVDEDNHHAHSGLYTAGVYLGTASLVTGVLLDIVRAPGAAHDWNARHRLSITPTALAAVDGPALGLGLGGRF